MAIDILQEIAQRKRQEVAQLHRDYRMASLQEAVRPSPLSFYRAVADQAAAGKPFIISEFKRKSPSEGWINQRLSVAEQVRVYREKGASAVSVLTDTPYFGGTYDDLATAAQALEGTGMLVLQKDFVIDPIQIYLARLKGAHLILLIAALLEPEQLQALKQTAESLGMGVLAEIHSVEEYERIREIGFPVVGVNNRNLSTFKTALNCCNYIAQHIDHRGHLIAESGMGSALDLRIASQHAHGYLIGTSLMRHAEAVDFGALARPRYFLKACGIRTEADLEALPPQGPADLVGINFSPISKRRGEPGWLEGKQAPPHAVAVFKNNSPEEVLQVLHTYGFRYAQLYADDFGPEFVRQVRQKVLLAISVRTPGDVAKAEAYAPHVDCFLLDGAQPGSGQAIEAALPPDFPYPFLLAGGLHAGNLDRLAAYRNCIGADMASGIETQGAVDLGKIDAAAAALRVLQAPAFA